MSSPAQPSDDHPETSPTPESPLHPVSLLAGAASAATAAVIGGRLGLSGTVAGAAVGSIVAAVAATTIKHWGFRGRDAVRDVTRRATSVPVPRRSARSSWRQRAALAGGGFAVGIVALLVVQLAAGTSLSRGSGQLQEAATRVMAPTAAATHHSAVRATPSVSPSTLTPSVAPASSTTASPSAADPVKAPASSAPAPSTSAAQASSTPSTTPS